MLESLVQDPITAGALATFALAVAGGAFALGWKLSRRETPSPARDEARSDVTADDLRKTVWILQNENKNLSTFLMLLPDIAREINASHNKRNIAPLLMGMVDQIFAPEQVLVFLASQRGDRLTLAAHRGLPPSSGAASKTIPFGEGRVGWIASNQIAMDENEFQAKARFLQKDLDPHIHPDFKVELAAPMVHQERTLGVITVGGMLRHPKNEKNMLRMVADLGSVALSNSFYYYKMEEMANSDGLTGLKTKRYFLQKLAEEIVRADGRHEEFSLFIFDIDHFKHYNDSNGHPAGDEALKITGRLLRESIREEDLPARYGGEEFIVLLPGTLKEGAAVAAEKIRAKIQGYEYPKEKNQPGGDLTISGGVASYPYDGRTSAQLISAADEALYKAKRAGRNRVVSYEPAYLSESEQAEPPAVVESRIA